MLNKCIIRSKISEAKFREIIRFFCLDLEAKKIAEISGISRNSINKIFKAIRIRIAEYKVFTQIVKNCSASELLPIIDKQIRIGDDSIIFSDAWKSYDGLADFGYKKHYRVKHGKNQFAKRELGGKVKTISTALRNFWGLCKVRLVRFRGIHKGTFYLYLKV